MPEAENDSAQMEVKESLKEQSKEVAADNFLLDYGDSQLVNIVDPKAVKRQNVLDAAAAT